MPNWVDNTLTIKGEKNTLAQVRARLESGLDEGNFLWNIIHPKDEEMEDYKSVVGTGGKAMNDPSGWYMWNISHWGTKWDVSELQIHEDEGEVVYGFNTAWSPPTNAMISLSEQFPEVELTLRFVEEQGWGGESEYIGGEESVLEQWDIPESHVESIKAQGHCNCDWDSNEEDWFDDCPREEIKK